MELMIEGTMGSGKTLLATHIARRVDEEFGIPIYCNYELKLNNYKPLSLAELPNIFHECLVILDEAYVYLESRTSGRDVNRYMSYILMQSRKRKIDFILTFQLSSMIDLRWTGLTDYLVQSYRDNRNECFRYDIYGQGDRFLDSWELPFEYAEKELWGIYETMEPVETTQDMGKMLTLVDPKDTEKALSDLLGKMEAELPLDQWDKGMIRDFVMEERYPQNPYVDRIWGHIKRRGKREKV